MQLSDAPEQVLARIDRQLVRSLSLSVEICSPNFFDFIKHLLRHLETMTTSTTGPSKHIAQVAVRDSPVAFDLASSIAKLHTLTAKAACQARQGSSSNDLDIVVVFPKPFSLLLPWWLQRASSYPTFCGSEKHSFNGRRRYGKSRSSTLPPLLKAL